MEMTSSTHVNAMVAETPTLTKNQPHPNDECPAYNTIQL